MQGVPSVFLFEGEMCTMKVRCQFVNSLSTSCNYPYENDLVLLFSAGNGRCTSIRCILHGSMCQKGVPV